MGSKLLFASLMGLLAVSVAFLVYGWQLGEGARISGFGWSAMALGVLATLALGCGLMALVFLSARRGYDEAADPRRDDAADRPD